MVGYDEYTSSASPDPRWVNVLDNALVTLNPND